MYPTLSKLECDIHGEHVYIILFHLVLVINYAKESSGPKCFEDLFCNEAN